MSDVTVIVPNWAPLSIEMQAETGCRYAAFVILGGKPLYQHLIDQYSTYPETINFVFAVANDAPEFQLGDIDVNGQVDIVRLSSSSNIGDTVFQALSVASAKKHLIVQMADTLLNVEGLSFGDSILVQKRNDLYRWTSVVAGEEGRVAVISDREEYASADAHDVCVGLFSFTNGPMFFMLLQQALADTPSKAEPFFRAVERYSQNTPINLLTVESWFDCGHIDTYYQSRLGYQNLRHFNMLVYDQQKGQVTKTSRSKEAFRSQVRWYRQMPDNLSAFLPRIFSSSDGSEPQITMELLSSPTLGELFTDKRLPLGAWNGVVRLIQYIRACFDEMGTSSSLAEQLAYQVYFAKTHQRLSSFLSDQPGASSWWVEHKGRRWTIIDVLKTLDQFVHQTGLLQIDRLTPIHGDLCFSNLFYDAKIQGLKMIDPRGEFGVPGIFGDHRYDLAKLAHSFSGGYDFIVAGRFSARVDKDERLYVELEKADYHSKVQNIFETVLYYNSKLKKEVDAIQALLFLSMLPLHNDRPLRQVAMLATGLALYSDAWEGFVKK